MKEDKGDWLTLTAGLAVKLGSLVVHADELDPHGDGWEFDLAAIRALVTDPEVVEWLSRFSPALLPEKRNG